MTNILQLSVSFITAHCKFAMKCRYIFWHLDEITFTGTVRAVRIGCATVVRSRTSLSGPR